MKNDLLSFALSAMLLSAPLTVAPAFAADSAKVKSAEKVLMALPLNAGPSAWNRIEKIAYLKCQLSKLAPVKVKYDNSKLSDREKQVVKYLIEAGDSMDRLFRTQAYSKNNDIILKLISSDDEFDKFMLRYVLFNAGPFDRINDNYNFYSDDKKPAGAGFYPEDMTKAEFESFVKVHPELKDQMTSEFTVIVRDENKNLKPVPYHEYYKDELTIAVNALRKAADYADNPTLKRFLLSRAEALTTDDYYKSDVDWMTIEDSNIELVIGPYEVYEDSLMNSKASYEAFIYQNLPEEAKQFSKYVKYLPELENNLPIPDEDKNMTRDFTSPIRIVNLIYSSGDAKAGVHTSAFALPNDEKVRKEKGCKKVMMKNIMSAKFDASTLPIGKMIVDPSQVKDISFDCYFRSVVFHELSHGLGPGEVKMPDGSLKDVRLCLGDMYSAIEECKADTLAIHDEFYLTDKGVLSADDLDKMAVTYLTGIFRSVRFGIGEAHGKGALIQLNWMMEKGAFTYDEETGTYKVHFEKFRDAVKGLSKALLDIQRKGSYEEGAKFLDKYAQVPSHLTTSLKKLYEIPIDIYPEFEK